MYVFVLFFRDGSVALHASLYLMHVGDRIRTIRTDRGYKQEYLATAAGVTQAHISRVERGIAKPTFAEMVSIARVLECPLEDFVSDDLQGIVTQRQY